MNSNSVESVLQWLMLLVSKFNKLLNMLSYLIILHLYFKRMGNSRVKRLLTVLALGVEPAGDGYLLNVNKVTEHSFSVVFFQCSNLTEILLKII